MTIKEAAAELGVTTRTVERYVETGRLPAVTEKGPDRRRRTTIEEHDLAALKAAMEQARAEKAQRVISPTVMQHISFRAEPEYLQLLAEEAVRRRLKPSECARQIFSEGLTSRLDLARQLEAMQLSLIDLTTEVQSLRRDVAQAVYQVLVEVQHVNQDEAREVVVRVFRPK